MKKGHTTEGWIIFLIMSLLFMLTYFHRVSLAICASTIMVQFSISATSLGILSSLYFYPYGFSQFPIGMIVDKFGPKKVVIIASLISAVGVILFALSKNFISLCIGRFLIGLGSSGIFVPTIKFISVWFAKTMFAKLVGINNIAGSLGGFLATTPFAFMISIYGWRTAFLGIFIITIILTICTILIVRDCPKKLIEDDNFQINDSANLCKYKISYIKIIDLGVIVGLQYAALMGIQCLWGAKILKDVLGYSDISASNLLLLNNIGLMIGGVATGFIIDRLPRRRRQVWIIELVMFTMLWIIFIFRLDTLSKNSLILIYFGFGFLNGTFVCANAELRFGIQTEYFGKAVGMMNGITFIIIALFQPLMSFLIQLGPSSEYIYSLQAYRRGLFLCLFLVLISLIMAIITFRNKKNLIFCYTI